jgi:hypothetical protein
MMHHWKRMTTKKEKGLSLFLQIHSFNCILVVQLKDKETVLV